MNGNILFFLWLSRIPLSVCVCVCVCVCIYIYIYIYIYIVSNAAMNTGVWESSRISVFGFLQIYTQEWNCWVIW